MSEFASIVEQADPMLREKLIALQASDVYQYIITAKAGNTIRVKGNSTGIKQENILTSNRGRCQFKQHILLNSSV